MPPWHFVYDENLGRWRPASAAFDNDPDDSPMSVSLAEELSAAGCMGAAVLEGHEGFALAGFPVGLARECGQLVVRDPIQAEPAHALLVGAKSKSVQRKLAKATVWIIPPPERAG